MDYINSYIDEWKRLRTDEEMFKEFLKNLTPESFMEFIMKINKDLRRDDDEEIISEGVIAGELVATTKSVREEIIKQLVDYLKQEPNMKEAATLIYCLLINFHMFSDGNGRTARFIYDLFSNNLDESQFMYYFHKEDNTHYDGKKDFEEVRGIADLGEINWITNSFIEDDIKDILEEFPHLDNKVIVCGIGGFYANRQNKLEEMFKEKFDLDLTEEEYAELVQLLTDDGGVIYTPSGLGMLMVSIEKGDIEEWINMNEELIESCKDDPSIYRTVSQRMAFSIKKGMELLSKWTTEDFRKVIKIANQVKQRQLSHLISVFMRPEAYSYDGSIPLKDYFVDRNSVNKDVKKSL